MATSEERHALLGVPCPHCSAKPGDHCTVPNGRRRGGISQPITTLDGNAHEARWQAALGRSAPVDGVRVAELHARPARPVVAASADRPW